MTFEYAFAFPNKQHSLISILRPRNTIFRWFWAIRFPNCLENVNNSNREQSLNNWVYGSCDPYLPFIRELSRFQSWDAPNIQQSIKWGRCQFTFNWNRCERERCSTKRLLRQHRIRQFVEQIFIMMVDGRFIQIYCSIIPLKLKAKNSWKQSDGPIAFNKTN